MRQRLFSNCSYAYSQAGLADARWYVLLMVDSGRETYINAPTGELRDHEVYSCHVSPDGLRLATAAGGVLL